MSERYDKVSVLLEIIFPQMQSGFNQALANDFKLIDNFYKGYNLSIDTEESILIFQTQLSLLAQEDLSTNLQNQMQKYIRTNNRLITKNHALFIFLDSAYEQYQVGLSLENLITNKEYKKFARQARNRNFELIQEKARSFIANA